VHDEFKGIELDLLRAEHPDAKVLVHPESPENVVAQADVVGSTTQLIDAAVKLDATHFIVATDLGILHKMQLAAPGKTFIEAPTAGNSATCKSCAHCPWMAMNGLRTWPTCSSAATTRSSSIRRSPRVRACRSTGCSISQRRTRSACRRAAICSAISNCSRTWGRHERRGIPLFDSVRVQYGAAFDEAIARNVADAIAEDVGAGDQTGRLVPADERRRARIIVREEAVLCGVPWFEAVIARIDPSIVVQWRYREGDRMTADSTVCELDGPARALLTAERNGLNFLQLLSGVATATRRYVDRVEGTRAKILDTRKTLPGLRLAQKYAVRVGGGENQRLALYDGILIKENHIAAAGGWARRSTPRSR
jgi:hypothetical protein